MSDTRVSSYVAYTLRLKWVSSRDEKQTLIIDAQFIKITSILNCCFLSVTLPRKKAKKVVTVPVFPKKTVILL